ncbi:hypothetical protein CB1_000336006 [Camelus ferus]|nr:hypothetical protein CB1_000336006 [Camelus ferus]
MSLGILMYTCIHMRVSGILMYTCIHMHVLSEHGFGPITTDIREGQAFYYAEDYHQQYLSKNPDGYCGLGGTGVACPLAPRQNTDTVLQKVKIQLVNWETCSNIMPVLTKNMLCAGDFQGGKDACQSPSKCCFCLSEIMSNNAKIQDQELTKADMSER